MPPTAKKVRKSFLKKGFMSWVLKEEQVFSQEEKGNFGWKSARNSESKRTEAKKKKGAEVEELGATLHSHMVEGWVWSCTGGMVGRAW